mgnify:CR=1 FL=1
MVSQLNTYCTSASCTDGDSAAGGIRAEPLRMMSPTCCAVRRERRSTREGKPGPPAMSRPWHAEHWRTEVRRAIVRAGTFSRMLEVHARSFALMIKFPVSGSNAASVRLEMAGHSARNPLPNR